MKKLILLSLLVAAVPLFAEEHTDLFFDIEGVHRTGANTAYAPGVIRFEPAFNTGTGIGGGVNFFFTDHVSLEGKVAAIEGRTRIRIIGQDSIQIMNLGYTYMYPISATLQWHTSAGAVRPYFGGGVVHTVLHNVNQSIPGTTVNSLHFRDPTGLVLDGGLCVWVARHWDVYGDLRYVPMETRSRAEFVGTSSFTEMRMRPLIFSIGLAFRH